jgi:hypothetical protein
MDFHTEQAILEQLEQLDPMEVKMLQFQTHVFRILTSIYCTKSIEEQPIIDDIFLHYDGNVPKNLIKQVVTDILPYVLHGSGLVFPDGKLTLEGEHIAKEHLKLCNITVPTIQKRTLH